MSSEVDFAPVSAVADAVLFEGYLLYPYRRSSPKNRVRWQFGVLAPRPWIDARGPVTEGIAGSAESWWNQTECLLEGPPSATVELRVRFLHLERPPQPEDPFDRALPCDCPAAFTLGQLLEGAQVLQIDQPGGGQRQTVSGRAVVSAERVAARSPLYRLRVRVENTADLSPGALRPEALRCSLVSTHLLLGSTAASFMSQIDPPEWAAAAARECRNVRAFPVLGGPAGTSNLVVSAPIILDDHPRVAPESPGDLFDAAEIDEILSLRTMTLTEAEKAEARATDRRAAEIIDRVDAMPPEVLGRLHGAIRSFGPRPQSVMVAGVRVTSGMRVRLRPRKRGTDAQDMFLSERTATVSEILIDVDGTRFLAVSLDDDPRAEMGAGPGRLLHFSPDEIALLP